MVSSKSSPLKMDCQLMDGKRTFMKFAPKSAENFAECAVYPLPPKVSKVFITGGIGLNPGLDLAGGGGAQQGVFGGRVCQVLPAEIEAWEGRALDLLHDSGDEVAGASEWIEDVDTRIGEGFAELPLKYFVD